MPKIQSCTRIILIAALTVAVGCRRHPAPAPLPASVPVRAWPGVQYRETVLPEFPEHERLWIYVPEDGRRTHACVFIAAGGSNPDGSKAGGSNLVTGERLSEEHRESQLPYVRAGYAVVGYDVSGTRPADGSPVATSAAIRLFLKREAGIANGRAAVEYALKHLHVDPLRLYAAGEGSAGTLALLLASTDSRIRGCVAYSPVTDVAVHLAGNLSDEVRYFAPEALAPLCRYSPMAMTSTLKCPVFIFQAEASGENPPPFVRQYVTALEKTNRQVTFVDGRAASTEIREGIAWLGRDRLPKK